MSTPAGPSKGIAFTNWLVNKTAGLLEKKSSRRGFLLGSAMVGSAVAVAGCAPGTQPGSPYNHITDCAGGLCTDGYTEFCCTINNGLNACPPGSFAGGWWRADFSSFCNGTRYYIDCMENCCGPNLGNGFCAGRIGVDVERSDLVAGLNVRIDHGLRRQVVLSAHFPVSVIEFLIIRVR